MADLAALIERVEKLTGPSRDADYRIEKELVRPCEFPASGLWPPFMVGSKFERSIPAYTASLDAAVALVERVLPADKTADHEKSEIRLQFGDFGCNAVISRDTFISERSFYASAKTPTIALILAALRALQAQEGRDG